MTTKTTKTTKTTSKKIMTSKKKKPIPPKRAKPLSLEKRQWCKHEMFLPAVKLVVSRLYALHLCAWRTVYVSNKSSNVSLAYSYLHKKKLHDRETLQLVEAIEKFSPGWFDSYPRMKSTEYDEKFKAAVVGELMMAYFKCNIPEYSKPNLRKEEIEVSPKKPSSRIFPKKSSPKKFPPKKSVTSSKKRVSNGKR